jgi:PTS system mannose-specific IIC component
MVLAVLGVAFASGLIGLDRTAAGQFMVSQPLVAAPLTGWMLGDPVTGLLIGSVLELIWVLDLPVGTFVPADSTVAAVCATAAAILGGTGSVSASVIGFSILLSTGLAPVTIVADHVIRKYNARLADTLPGASGADLGHRLAQSHLSGLVVFYVKFFLLSLIFIPLGMGAVRMFIHLPDFYHRAMAQYLTILPLLGVALMARKLSIRTVDRFLLGGFAIAVIAGLLHTAAFIVVLLSVAAGWLGDRYRDQRP